MGALPYRIDRLHFITSHAVDVLRLDLIHPVTGGNKLFKLKYNIREALRKKAAVVTFGGHHSNHIAATAAQCASSGLQCVGFIRGHGPVSTPTLEYARSCGMELIFADKAELLRPSHLLEKLKARIGNVHVIPQGGQNPEGLRGCSEILPRDHGYQYVMLACGTGTTYGGMLRGRQDGAIFIGISPLKGENRLPGEVGSMLLNENVQINIAGDDELERSFIRNHCIVSAFAGKGFGRFDADEIVFRKNFIQRSQIELDYVYMPKLMRAAVGFCASGKIPGGAKVLVVHSGGLQGNAGFERRYAQHLLPAG